eukprot:COSAG06_NODE_2245_length_7263_cov_19.964964_8_plen_137_part_00
MIREGAPGGTYTSAPMLAWSSIYPVLRSTNAPERDVLHRFFPTGCVVKLAGTIYMCPALHSAQMLVRLGLIARPAFVCCGTCPPRGHSIASVARSAGLHPLRISLYARAAGSRDATVFSVTLQYNTYCLGFSPILY